MTPERDVGQTTGEMTLRTFVTALASAGPTPGGGAAGAVALALGRALVAMASGISARARKAPEADRAGLAQAASEETAQAVADLDLGDADADAFAAFMAALSLPRNAPDEVETRRRAVESAARAAAGACRRAAQEAVDGLDAAASVAGRVRPTIVEDVRAAVVLLEASLSIALANLESNASYLPAEERDGLFASARALAEDGRARADAARRDADALEREAGHGRT